MSTGCHPVKAQAFMGQSGRWIIDDSIPTLTLTPKCASTTTIAFLNSCSSGRISPNQLVWKCSGYQENQKDPELKKLHKMHGKLVHEHEIPGPERRVYGLIRHPVKRMISFLEYRLSNKFKGADWTRAGLSMTANVSVIIDEMQDQSMYLFSPFRNITTYLGSAATILCSVDDFSMHVRQHFDFKGCKSTMPRKNPTRKSERYGYPRQDQLLRIARVLGDDMRLWKKACGNRSMLW